MADKYIEYELLLVSIDLILLREQAYRHILFNRNLLNRTSMVRKQHVCPHLLTLMKPFLLPNVLYVLAMQSIIPTLMSSVILINLLLKMVTVEQWHGEGATAADQLHTTEPSYFYPLYLLTASIVEHLVFVGTVFLLLRQWRSCSPFQLSLSSNAVPPPANIPTDSSLSHIHRQDNNAIVITKHFHRKIYLALSFPEMAKLVTLLLQTWDSSPTLFLVAGVLCLLFQYTSLCVALSYFRQKQTPSYSGGLALFLVAVLAKVAVRASFHSPRELLGLGVIM